MTRRLRFDTAYEQARQYLQVQQRRRRALYKARVHGPTHTERLLVFLLNPSTSRGLSAKLHSFWCGLYKFKKANSEMTEKICEMETDKRLIVHYYRMDPCRSPPSGFVPPTHTPPTPMNPQNEIPSNPPTENCHPFSSEAHLSCPRTVGLFAVSVSITISKDHHISPLKCHQFRKPKLLRPLRPWRQTPFWIAHMIPPSFLILVFPKPLTAQIVPWKLLFPPRCFPQTHLRQRKQSFRFTDLVPF